jgi:hypothetical protein
MTTYVQFAQPTNQPFSFQATLDGVSYTVSLPWSLYGQTYNIYISELDGTPILATILCGSPDDYDINIIKSYFTTSTLVYRVSSNNFEINP